MSPQEIAHWLAMARRMADAGKVDAARACLGTILAAVPGQPDALHDLGTLALSLGQAEAAEALLRGALAARPGDPQFLNALGLALSAGGRVEEAASLFRQAASLLPQAEAPRVNLAGALSRLGRAEEALASLEGAPETAAVLHLRGRLRLSLGRIDQAAADLRRATGLNAGLAAAWNDLGVAVRRLGDGVAALAAYERALALDPDFPEARLNLANALLGMDRPEEAEAQYRRLLDVRPDHAEGLHGLGQSLFLQGRPAAAEPPLREALRLRPGWSDAAVNLAVCLDTLDRVAEAERLFRDVIARQPEDAAAWFNLSLLLLRVGRFDEGWAAYEWRWRLAGFPSPPRHFAQPAWDGRADRGMTLLVHLEQGLGDSIQFVRFLAAARWRVGRLVLECRPELLRLFRSLPGVDELVPLGEPLPAFDVQLPLMSLPKILGIGPDDLALAAPYLTPPADTPRRAGGPPRIGLVWSGSPDFRFNRLRSIPLAELAPLLRTPGVRFVSLQAGPAAAERSRFPDIEDAVAGVRDMADTAAVVAGLDLVIGTDTAVMHLAAALGRPTWMLLSCPADWRWFREASDSPWYPSLRLFRRRVEDEGWSATVASVAAALRDWTTGFRRRQH